MKDCKEAKIVMPIIHFGKCEGKRDCLEVCPYDVFEIRKAQADEIKELSFIEKFKSFAHGHQKAFVINPELCHNCGLCITACPEKAIKMTKFIATNKV